MISLCLIDSLFLHPPVSPHPPHALYVRQDKGDLLSYISLCC